MSDPTNYSPLRESCVLVDYHGGYYNWQRRDARNARELSESKTHRSDSFTAYKNLFVGTDGILSAMKSVINEARSYHYTMTLPAPKSWGTAAFISNALVPIYRQEMTKFEHKLDALRIHLKNEWQVMLGEAKKNLGSAFDAGQYPTLEEVLSACYIKVDFRPVPDASDVSHPTLGFIRNSMKAEAAEAQKANLMEVWRRFHEVIQTARKNLMKLDPKQGRFRTEWMDNLKVFLPVLQNLNLTDDPLLNELAAEAEKLLRHDADTLKQQLGKRETLAAEADRLFKRLSGIYTPMQQADSKDSAPKAGA